MTTEDNKLFDQQFMEMVLNNEKSELLKNFYTSEFVDRMLEEALILRKAFPDLHYIIEDQIAEKDKIVTRWTASGTHRGELVSPGHPGSPAIPPTGKRVSWGGVTISRLAMGKYVEQWINIDKLSILQQLGAVQILSKRAY